MKRRGFYKRAGILATALALLLSAAPANARARAAGGEITESGVVAASGSLSLFYDIDACAISVTDGKSGKTWRSSPQNLEDDEKISGGSIRNEMYSQLVVRFAGEKDHQYTANSWVSSCRQGTCKAHKTDGGLIITFDFSREKERFIIPVSYRLKNGALEAEILYDQIDEYGGNRLLEIRLLPYFGARQAGDGFLFVPDGSGATIALGEEKSWAPTYSKQVYGEDPALSSYPFTAGRTQICLPVFGLSDGTAGWQGIIRQGDASAKIEAIQPGAQSGYGSVAAGFIYRQMDTRELTESGGGARQFTYVSRYAADVNPVVGYYFLSDGSIAGMAASYRAYLTEEQGVKPAKVRPRLTLELPGATTKKASFLGIRYHKTVSATTVADLRAICDALAEKNAGSVDFILKWFGGGGTRGPLPKKRTVEGKLGGYGAYRNLLRDNAGRDYRFYYGVDFINVARASWGVWKWNSAAVSVMGTGVERFALQESTFAVDRSAPLSFFLKPPAAEAAARGFAEAFSPEANEGLLLMSMGEALYSDYSKNAWSSRDNTARSFLAAGAALSEGSKVAADGPHAYMLGTAGALANVPSTSSLESVFTASVPFVALALHGLVDLSGTPLNGATDPAQALYELLTGISPCYRLTGCDPYLLRDTALRDLLNTNYRHWLEEAVTQYERFMAVQEKVKDQFITGYMTRGALSAAVYADGTAVVINTGEKEEQFGSVRVPAMGYAVTRESKLAG